MVGKLIESCSLIKQKMAYYQTMLLQLVRCLISLPTLTGWFMLIDLFTDTAAILNSLDLRSIMGCPGDTGSLFTRAFRAKKRTSMSISREKGDHYYIQTQHNDLFSHYNLFLGKLKEQLARKARVNTVASISDRAHAPWASHNTP